MMHEDEKEEEDEYRKEKKKKKIMKTMEKKKRKFEAKSKQQKKELYKFLTNLQEQREITAQLIKAEQKYKKKLVTGATIAYPCSCSFACNYLSIVRSMKRTFKYLYSNYHRLFDQYLYLFFVTVPNCEEDEEGIEELFSEETWKQKTIRLFFTVIFYPAFLLTMMRDKIRQKIMETFPIPTKEEENVSNVSNQADESGLQNVALDDSNADIYGILRQDWDMCFGKLDEGVVSYYRQLGKINCEMQKFSVVRKLFNKIFQFLYLEKNCTCMHCGAMTDCDLYASATYELYQEYCDLYSDYLALWFAVKVEFKSQTVRYVDVHDNFHELASEVHSIKEEYPLR